MSKFGGSLRYSGAIRSMIAAISLAVAGPAFAQELKLNMGGVNPSSSVYAYVVALANTVAKHDPGILITAVEGGGGNDHIKLMRRKVLDLSVSGSPAVVDTALKGTGPFRADGAWDEPRFLAMRNQAISRIYVDRSVAEKLGITGWAGLKGKAFNPGSPGTRDMQRLLAINELLHTGVRLQPGSLEDASSKLSEGKLVGMLKGSPIDRFDTGMQSVHFSKPLSVLGFTKEEADKIIAADPLNTLRLTEKGSINEVPEAGPFYELSSPVMLISSARLDQAAGYRLLKAIHAGWDEITAAYPPSQGVQGTVNLARSRRS
jgi:TRAP-type uncharacterized transport system substrate-binding protein